MSHISVLVADDNRPIRELLWAALREHFEVLQPVADGRQLVESVLARTPDVVVSDVGMPVLGGIEALRLLKKLGCTSVFVMVSADSAVGRACLDAGADAFVCKDDIGLNLVPAVLAALRGRTSTRESRAAAGRGAGQPRLLTPALEAGVY
jgi:CheY-like chemotaxis protein